MMCGFVSAFLFIVGLFSDDRGWLIAAGLFAIASMM